MKKRLIIAVGLLILLSTYTAKNYSNLIPQYNISKLIIQNNDILNREELINQLSFLKNKNIIFLQTREIKNKLEKFDFIESFEIKKIYPDTIKIKIFEKKPIIILQYKEKKYYYTSKNNFINFIELNKFKNLPVAFGDKKNFKTFYNQIKKINFPINTIEKFYLYESKRWDLITKKKQTIKLPVKNYEISLKNFVTIENQNNFKKYKLFDYRINDQLILK